MWNLQIFCFFVPNFAVLIRFRGLGVAAELYCAWNSIVSLVAESENWSLVASESLAIQY